jgi:hypothetical protein
MGKTYKRVALNPNLGGGVVEGSTSFTSTFLVGGWSLVSGKYEITINETTHQRGANPLVQVWEKVGSDYVEAFVDIEVDTAGNITLIIDSIPDLRFEGKVNIIGE